MVIRKYTFRLRNIYTEVDLLFAIIDEDLNNALKKLEYRIQHLYEFYRYKYIAVSRVEDLDEKSNYNR